ncbi:MAG TPA: SDR family NAD(P)-dependent oxidoreductase, partial [Pyrinomonadaceae bacterium]
PHQPGDYRLLLDELRRDGNLPHQVLHLWNLSAADAAPTFDQSQSVGYGSLLQLGKVLGEIDEPLEIVVVSNGLQCVTGEEELHPEKATLLGPCTTIPQEYPHLTCRSIDVAMPLAGSWQEQKLCAQLVAESRAQDGEKVTAYRHGSRWVQAFEAVALDEPAENSFGLREEGIYLITGGLGKIGLALAEYLTSAARVKVVLTGRSPLPARESWDERLKTHGDDDETSRKILKLRALEESGAEVLYLCADVTDEEQMRAVFEVAEERLGPVCGVIHAAGFLPEQTFRLIRDAQDSEGQWVNDPKVQGLLTLERVLSGRKIDFCVLMSSISSVLGGLGYTTYAAANLFMDAFARKQNRLGPTPWVSVNWDAWTFGNEPQQQTGVGASLTAMSMTAEEGLGIFRRLLAHGPFTQVVVSTTSLQDRIERWIKLDSLRAEKEQAAHAPRHPRPSLPTSFVAPSSEAEKIIAEIWQQLLGLEQVGIHDDFFTLGGESLLAVQLTSRIRAALHVEIGPGDLFDTPTVAALAEVVEGRRRHQPENNEAPPPRQGAVNEAAPLSFAQQQLWVVCQLGDGETAYNIPTATLLRGPLNVGALEQSLNEIVRRHETLRTCFPVVDGRPLPVINPTLHLSLPIIDLSETPAEGRLERARDIAGEEARTPFDLSCAPLLRARLVRAGEEEHVLLLTMHHIVTDGWSIGVLIEEMAALYEAFSTGKPPSLPALPIQYSDFAAWQRRVLTGEKLESLIDYWKQRLGDHLPKLKLPTDRPRSAARSLRAGTVPFLLAPPLPEALRALSREEGATLFMTLLAAFDVLLRHHSGEDRVAVGTDVANRQRAEAEGMIGFFVNQLVLLTDLSGDPSFRSLLARVREVTLGAYAHQEMPFGMLVELLNPEREVTHSPLFQVKLVLQNAPAPPVRLPNLDLSPIEVENPYAKFDLLLTVWESERGLSCSFEYKEELYDRTTIVDMISDYEAIVLAVVSEPNARLSTLDELLAERRRRRVLAREREAQEVARMKLKNVKRKPLGPAGT